MQTFLVKAQSLVSRLRPRHFIIAFFVILMAFILLWSASRIKSVTVDVDGEKTFLTTAMVDPYEILESLGIEIDPRDRVTITGFDNRGFFGEIGNNKAEIRIQSAVNAKIVADKITYHATLAKGDTVGDLLDISGLELREHDYMDAEEDQILTEGDSVKLTRVDYITTTQEEAIERGETVRGTSLLKSNSKVIISYGKNGTLLNTFEQKVVDGVYQEKELVSQDVTKAPIDDIYLIGDGSPCSPLDYGYEIVNGVPTKYIEKFEKKRATGYYAPYGAGTATGRRAQMGYVAVDPKIIPYGTKMWIVAHGNSGFVYGYALAADTGGAMLSGKNFVDLYYDTYYECVLNGLRYVDVYILEWGVKKNG